MTGFAERTTPGTRTDWQTPEHVLERVRRVAPIGLDPCTTHANPTGARAWWYLDGPFPLDGLASGWSTEKSGHLVYCNPPYGRGIGAWMDKCHEAAVAGVTVIALVPARTDTRWFPWTADAICFWRGRLTFRDAPAPAMFPSAVVLWTWGRRGSRECFNRTRDSFCAAFGDAGKVISL